MMTSIKICFLTIILLSFMSACSSSGNRSGFSAEEIVFDDGYKSNSNGEIVIDDVDFTVQENTNITSDKISQKTTQIVKDGSQIVTTFDGFGNKTETRTFYNNALLRLITLNTDVDGSKKVFVYGQNGKVKSLPEDMLKKILTASPTELANAAGIFEVVKEQLSFVQNTQPNSVSLKPQPSSQFPIQNRQVEQTSPPEEIEQPSGNVEKQPSVENKNDEPTAKRETAVINKKSDGK